MSSLKENVQDAGQAVADTAKKAGRKIADGAEQAADWVKEKVHSHTDGDAKTAAIREHMDVIASCGTRIGTVDRREGDTIKLTKSNSPDGQHHFIPLSWVEKVDEHVHLKKNSMESMREWKKDAASCGCGS